METIINTETYKYLLRYYEKDLNKNLKLVSIFNFLQDVAAIHAESNGFGESFVFSKTAVREVIFANLSINVLSNLIPRIIIFCQNQ